MVTKKFGILYNPIGIQSLVCTVYANILTQKVDKRFYYFQLDEKNGDTSSD